MKRLTAGLLAAACVLAVGTPAYLSYAAPHLAGYVLHPSILILQALPYAICAALWIPAWAPGSGTASVVVAAVLLLTALLVYTPVIQDPSSRGGDMIGLAFVAISIGTTVVVLSSWAVAALLMRSRRRGGA